MNDTIEYKGDISGFPREVVERMFECQVEQGNKRSLLPFENEVESGKERGGFNWKETKEGESFWSNVISFRKFDHFFARYPKKNKYPIGGYTPGNYSCHCTICKEKFQGDKRAVQCEPCAEKMVNETINPEVQATEKTLIDFNKDVHKEMSGDILDPMYVRRSLSEAGNRYAKYMWDKACEAQKQVCAEYARAYVTYEDENDATVNKGSILYSPNATYPNGEEEK